MTAMLDSFFGAFYHVVCSLFFLYMKSIVDVTDLGVVRQGKQILANLNIQMSENQHLAVIGPNGAGKSFLLRVLSADMIPSSGTVTILGKTFGQTNLWELRKRIGFVSTRLAFWYEGNTSVLDVVCSGFYGTFGLPEEATSQQKDAAWEMLEFFGMQDFADHTFETLSDGERRKVLLCRAMVTEPELLIFDEPCQGLDIPSREVFLGDVEKLAQKIPIIYVSHHLEELPQCISDVVFLKHGTVYAKGTKQEMLTTEHMSAVFDYNIAVIEKGHRYYVQHAGEESV